MILKLIIPILLFGMILFVILYVAARLIKMFAGLKKPPNIPEAEYRDLTNEKVLQEILNNQNEIKNNLVVIKYCLIFFVVAIIFSAAFAIIAYVISLLS